MTPDQYHDATKHHFHRFAPSLGFLDWASQPDPFRSFAGATAFPLYRSPATSERPSEGGAATGTGYVPADVSYGHLYRDEGRRPSPEPALPLSAAAIGDVLRHAFGLSAWKRFGESRWALRVNPSSGNLHPTEAYVLVGPLQGLGPTAGVYHYAADRHALEQRAAFDTGAWTSSCADSSATWLVALTSIHWREAWKYGERAFRYCQHDLGHAIAAVRLAASLVGWKATLLPEWSHADVAALAGTEREQDYVEAEHEEPGCVMRVTSVQSSSGASSGAPAASAGGSGIAARPLVEAIRAGRWSGRANRLSPAHVHWPLIDEVAAATVHPGCPTARALPAITNLERGEPAEQAGPSLDARAVILQRRSAVAFDGRSSMDRSAFVRILDRAMPGPGAPWDALWWTPRIHLALFVHRIDGIDPGLYVLPRDPSAVDRLKAAFGREFLWAEADPRLPLLCLATGDCRGLARRLSCDQDIAADGFFSLGMIADFDRGLSEYGPSFYRCLFWESGVVGQVLYLEAEAAGARATGIGCFYDDPVHDVLGIADHSFQSLYHFTMGMPVDDGRLTTEPGYPWEGPGRAGHSLP